MMRKRKYLTGLLICIACCHHLAAQFKDAEDSLLVQTGPDSIPRPKETHFTVREIVIEGNRKTKDAIILREIPFKPGDEYLLQELVKKFETARERLMNTTLFHEAIVALKSFDGYNIDILVQVKERWYIFPVPYFKPVDRNLNQWLVEQKGSFKRVNYGGKLIYNNVTGRNDKLKFWLIGGYTKQIMFNYDRLYIDRNMKWGMLVGLSAGKTRELNYKSDDDKQIFLNGDTYLRKFTHINTELTYRRAIRTRHRFGIGYVKEKVADTILKLNPNYFNEERTSISFPRFYYTMTYYDLDYIPYPTRGYAAEVNFQKEGINKSNNLWYLNVKGSAHWPTGKRSFFSLNSYAAIKLPFKQPFYNQRLLGYNDVFIQGYEYYVIDGVAGGYLRASMSRRFFSFDINLPGTKKLVPTRVPIHIYGRVYGNTGYVYNSNETTNNLSNRMLFSAGVGIDIVTIYDFSLRVDWSLNQLGQNGIFLHRKVVF